MKNFIPLLFISFLALYLGACSKVKFENTEEYIESLKVKNPAVFINNDEPYTNEAEVSLQIEARNASEMYLTNDPTCETGGEWQDYQDSEDWQLENLNQEVRVYAKFRQHENYESDCVSDSIVHDDIAPQVLLVSAPAAKNNLKLAQVKFKVEDENSGVNVSYCQLNKNQPELCENQVQYQVSEGTQQVAIQALDRAGNSSLPLGLAWFTDHTGPSLEILSGPTSYDNKTQVGFLFEGQDATGIQLYQCSVNGEAWQECRDVFETAISKEGQNIFYLRALDNVNNWSEISSYPWISDFTPPHVEWVATPMNLSNKVSEVLEFKGQDNLSPVTFFCSLDQSAPSPCPAGSLVASQLGEGQHNYAIYAQDLAGNRAEAIHTNWLTDLQAPFLKNVVLPQDMTNQDEGVIQFQVDDLLTGVEKVNCQLNNQAFNCGKDTSYLVSGLNVGLQKLKVSAQDLAGNLLSQELDFRVYQKVREETQDFDLDNHGELDIVFVMDNSGSMESEQEKMSQKFSSFLPFLKDLDWKIAITTTDLTGDRDYEDGQLVHFGDSGHRWIHSGMSFNEANSLFKDTIQREEDGSDTESGVGASYRALQRFENGERPHVNFFREKAHLDIVVVSDEDESRSTFSQRPGMLIDKVQGLWPGKDFRFHSIVVQEGDEDCNNYNHTPGLTYEWLSRRTDGVIASVCAPNYGVPLMNIGDRIRQAHKIIKLNCLPFDRDQDGKPDIEITHPNFPQYRVQGSELILDGLIPLGKFEIKYFCAE